MNRRSERGLVKAALTFDVLVGSIRTAHEELLAQAGRAVNVCLTLRNWLIGHYIAEYELKGADRARYGDKLLKRLSAQLLKIGISRCEERELRRYRQLYQAYPQIRDTLSPEFRMKKAKG